MIQWLHFSARRSVEMFVLVAFVAFATFFETQAQPLSLEDKEKIFVAHTTCRIQNGIEEQVITKFCLGEQTDDPKLKVYLLCVSKEIGLQNENGVLQIDVMKTKLLKRGHNSTEIDRLVEKCAIQKESDLETAYNVYKCYLDNVNNYDGMLYVVSITPVRKRKLIKYHKECVEDTKVDEDLVKKAHDGEFSEDSTLKQYLLCLTKKLGFQDAEGKIQRDVIKQKLSSVMSDDRKVEKLVEVCVSEKDLPENTAYFMVKCLAEKSYVTILPPVALPPEKLDELFLHYTECRKQTSVTRDLVVAASIGNFTEDPVLKEYFLCMSKKVGFQNEDGVLQKDVIKQKIGDVLQDPEALEKLLEKCTVQGDSPANTAYSTVECYYKNTPNHTNIFRKPPVTIASNKEELSKYNTDCMEQSQVDPGIMEQVKKGTFPEDEKLKSHLFCFFKKLGLQNEAGEIETKQLNHKMGNFLGDDALSEKLAEKCAVQMDTPGNTALKALVCYYENTPSHFNIFCSF